MKKLLLALAGASLLAATPAVAQHHGHHGGNHYGYHHDYRHHNGVRFGIYISPGYRPSYPYNGGYYGQYWRSPNNLVYCLRSDGSVGLLRDRYGYPLHAGQPIYNRYDVYCS